MLTELQVRSMRPHCLAMAGSILKYCKVDSLLWLQQVIPLFARCYLIERASQERIERRLRLRWSFEANGMGIDMVSDREYEKTFGKVI